LLAHSAHGLASLFPRKKGEGGESTCAGGGVLGPFWLLVEKSVVSESLRRAVIAERAMANFFARLAVTIQVAVLCLMLGVFLFFLVWAMF
jgi:hypothetical protein